MLNENITQYMNDLLNSNPSEVNLYKEDNSSAKKHRLPSSMDVKVEDTK